MSINLRLKSTALQKNGLGFLSHLASGGCCLFAKQHYVSQLCLKPEITKWRFRKVIINRLTPCISQISAKISALVFFSSYIYTAFHELNWRGPESQICMLYGLQSFESPCSAMCIKLKCPQTSRLPRHCPREDKMQLGCETWWSVGQCCTHP